MVAMAVNDSESMNLAFVQGTVDNTYIPLVPNRKNVENPPVERYDWPYFARADRDIDPPFLEAHLRRAALQVERKTRYGGDPRAV
jgi:hypothetical protein